MADDTLSQNSVQPAVSRDASFWCKIKNRLTDVQVALENPLLKVCLILFTLYCWRTYFCSPTVLKKDENKKLCKT